MRGRICFFTHSNQALKLQSQRLAKRNVPLGQAYKASINTMAELSLSLQKNMVDRLVSIVGKDAVISRESELVVYECDAYTMQKNLPTAVVLPATTEEVAQVVQVCNELELPIIPRGAGTSLSGSVLAVDGGVMIALTRMNRILKVDVRNRRALVEAGCVNAWITREASPHGLFFRSL